MTRSPRIRSAARGVTLVDVLIAVALGGAILAAFVSLFGLGSRMVATGSKSSAAHTDLRILLETLARDFDELSRLAALNAGERLVEMDVQSARPEPGLDPACRTRRVTYSQVRREGGQHTLSRAVVELERGAPKGGPLSRVVSRTVLSARLVAMVAQREPAFWLEPLEALAPGAAEARDALCVLVDLVVGEPGEPRTAAEESRATLAVKLWCGSNLTRMIEGQGPR